MANASLQQRLADLKRRLFAIAAGCGAGWAVCGAASLLILAMWLDLMVELPPALRLTADIVAIVTGGVLCARLLIFALREALPLELGWRIDHAADARGQVVSGIDLMMRSPQAESPVSHGLAQLAIERADEIAARVPAVRVLPNDPLRRMGQALFGLAIFIAAVFIISPRLATTQLGRFADPYGDHPPFSRITFGVQPGNTSVVYGGNLDVKATAKGGAVEEVELVLEPRDSSEETLPMFAGPDGAWTATITGVTVPGSYLVRAKGARTQKFQLGVITVPQIREARFRITPPAYTHRTAYEGPLPQGGIAGLPGTKVEMWLKSNRPLSGGSIEFDAKKSSSAATQPILRTVEMSSLSSGSDEVAAAFTITQAGVMNATVIDTAGERCTQVFSAPISLLADERPFVRVLEPKQFSLATPDVVIPVQVAAEDDYGLSRLQLYRGLNQLRASAEDLAVPRNQPVRIAAQSQLALKDYGLKPGDMVKLYARVEDNDPAGPKGSESPIATIKIISEEDMQRIQLSQQGMEVLQSKYEQAARRMEEMDKQIRELQKELEKLNPNSEASKDVRDKIANLADKMDQEAAAMEKSAAQDLPFDLDKALRAHLKDLAKSVHDAANETRELSKKPKMSIAGAKGALDEVAKKMAAHGQQFKDDATAPLEHLDRIFPLKQDEARFVELYQRQRELEQRMQSLRGQDKKDDPQLKSRMRDLEEEQAKVQQDLRDLLTDIDNHLNQLPEDQKLNDLRETARKFAADLRASPVDEQMTSAQSALADFSGTQAHTSAKDAADTMEKFLGKCNSMGNEASACLKFQPGLANGLGDTVDQMLSAMSLGANPGMGMGTGGGYSAQRSTLNNVGLYGHLPTRSSASGAGGTNSSRGAAMNVTGGGDDAGNANDAAHKGDRAAGEAAAAVPPQYRRRVGEYFRRVADELGEQKR